MSDQYPPSLFRRLEKCASLLRDGGLLVYPTETYYALGCSASNYSAVAAIYEIKARPPGKPLPLLASDFEQAASLADFSGIPRAFFCSFWPGPLSALVPAIAMLPHELVNRDGKLAVRVSSSRIAACLAKMAGEPIVATSANLSGRCSASEWSGLDRELLARLERSGHPWAVLAEEDDNCGGVAPSTLVEPAYAENGELIFRILREGRISAAALQSWSAGFFASKK